jgi:hypothetical protein
MFLRTPLPVLLLLLLLLLRTAALSKIGAAICVAI